MAIVQADVANDAAGLQVEDVGDPGAADPDALLVRPATFLASEQEEAQKGRADDPCGVGVLADESRLLGGRNEAVEELGDDLLFRRKEWPEVVEARAGAVLVTCSSSRLSSKSVIFRRHGPWASVSSRTRQSSRRAPERYPKDSIRRRAWLVGSYQYAGSPRNKLQNPDCGQRIPIVPGQRHDSPAIMKVPRRLQPINAGEGEWSCCQQQVRVWAEKPSRLATREKDTMIENASMSTGPWRFNLGLGCFIAAFAIHLVMRAAIAAGANAATVGAIAAVSFALNKALLLIAAAIMGKPGFYRFKAGLFLGPSDATRPRTKSVRYATASVSFCWCDSDFSGLGFRPTSRISHLPSVGTRSRPRLLATQCCSSVSSPLAEVFGTSCMHSLFESRTFLPAWRRLQVRDA